MQTLNLSTHWPASMIYWNDGDGGPLRRRIQDRLATRAIAYERRGVVVEVHHAPELALAERPVFGDPQLVDADGSSRQERRDAIAISG